MSLHHPTVAIVGATGAVGAELIGCLERREFPDGTIAPACVRPFGGAQAVVPRPGHRGGGAERGRLPGRRYRFVFRRQHRIAAVCADGGAAGRGRGGQFLGLPHGTRRPAGGARGEPRFDRTPYRHHRQPELRGYRRGDGAVAIAPARPDTPGDRCHLPGGIRRGRRGDAGTAQLDRRLSGRQRVSAPACCAIPTRSTCSATTPRSIP